MPEVNFEVVLGGRSVNCIAPDKVIIRLIFTFCYFCPKTSLADTHRNGIAEAIPLSNLKINIHVKITKHMR